MSEVFPQLGYQIGIGAVGGFIVGFLLKKVSKIVAVIAGLIIIVLIYFGASGTINMNFDALWNAVAGALGMAGSAAS
jgi:uncharacterized membrane protein (Fun14 family)